MIRLRLLLPTSKVGESPQGRIASILTLDSFSWLFCMELFV